MLGKLNKTQIDDVLYGATVGRIGCYANNKIYVVPITYVYDGKCIYARSKEGMKIEMMRENPSVCFEVDVMENMANWRSVILWGTFAELEDEPAIESGMKILQDKLMPLIASETAINQPHEMRAPHIVVKEKKAIIFRIVIHEFTGRFEKSIQ